MDALDRKIVDELSIDGRLSVTELAQRLPLSLSATSERLRRLRESGAIKGFTVVVDPASIGNMIDAVIDVRLAPGTQTETIDASLVSELAITSAMHLTGRFDLQLRVATPSVAELDRLLQRLSEEHGVEETNTRLVLRELAGFPRPAQFVS